MILHLWKHILYLFLSLSLTVRICTPSGIAQPLPEPITLKMQLVPFLGSAPFFIGEEEGFFTEQGLQIKFVKMVRSADGIPALVQGKLDVLYGSVSTGFLNAIARNAKIKFVADKGYLSPAVCTYEALLVRRVLIEERKLDNLAQIRGRRIAMNPVSNKAYFMEKLINTVGLSLDDIKIVDIPTPVMPEALEKGTIDFVSTTEPWVTQILQAGHAVLWMPFQKVMPDFQNAAILYGPTLLEKNPEAGRRLMMAYLKAVRQYNQGKTERNLKIMAKHTGLDQELLKKCCWPSLRNNGQINIESMIDFQKWALKRGYLDKELPANRFWDPSFVDYANKVLNTSTK